MFEEIIKKIEQYESIVIFGHRNPDGDCFGSQVALKAILKEHYPHKNVVCAGSGLPIFEEILGETDYVPASMVEVSLAIIIDCNDLERVEEKTVYEALDYAKIDHHIDTFTFKEGPQVVDERSSSTAELIYRLAKENNFVIPYQAAMGLYLGLYTDTGRFQYAFDYVRMFDIAKDLIKLGAEPTRITGLLNRSPISSLKIKQFIYNHYVKDPAGLIYVIATKDDCKELQITSANMTSNTSLIGHINNYPIWFIACETASGGMQVEMRSEGTTGINVQKVAVSFGGGGHKYAAGFTIDEFSQKNIDRLIDLLKKALNKREN